MKDSLQKRRQELRQGCKPIAGHGFPDAGAELTRVAAWCEQYQVQQDFYGEGALIEGFESQLAVIFGHAAARFMPSGSMAQGIAMRIACGSGGHFGMHPTSHLEIHEQRGYSHLFGLRATLVGTKDEVMLAEHLKVVDEPLHALLMELPTRENGGRLPSWSELLELCALARERGMHLHLDGARVWQAQAAYGRSFAEIGALFDSIYVSFYKDIGALSGAMLIGGEDFIKEAQIWQRRMGGNLYTLLPNVASASRCLDEKLPRFELYRKHTLALASELTQIEGLRLLPDPPQVSMMHVQLDLDPEDAMLARDRVAEETGLWLFGGVRGTGEPGRSYFEFTIGEATLDTPIDKVAAAFRSLLQGQ